MTSYPPVKAVLFDLDGTLFDTHEDLGHALNQTLLAHGLAELPMSTIRGQVSNGSHALVRLGFGELTNQTTHEAIRAELLSHYLANIATHTRSFSGIDQLLVNIVEHGLPWGIVTNKPSLYTDALMAKLDLPVAAAVVVCPDHVGVAKPDPKPLLHAASQLNVTPAAVVYVGDHKRDIESAHNAGMQSIAVGYGFIAIDDDYQSWQAHFNAATADDIWPIIHSLL